ncbi:hypothetical protein [Phaeodactylibacter sp.]|uniref:hypothetical protein n=1 Tax=Phaeodactylibacter sp. TaxID=1940289 RepID=UPI0032ED01B3
METRLLFHNELSGDSFTSKYRPRALACTLAVPTRSDAMKIERYIKALVEDPKAWTRQYSV